MPTVMLRSYGAADSVLIRTAIGTAALCEVVGIKVEVPGHMTTLSSDYSHRSQELVVNAGDLLAFRLPCVSDAGSGAPAYAGSSSSFPNTAADSVAVILAQNSRAPRSSVFNTTSQNGSLSAEVRPLSRRSQSTSSRSVNPFQTSNDHQGPTSWNLNHDPASPRPSELMNSEDDPYYKLAGTE